jgi:CRP/FNR family transcriptional regulator, cyclic AMP receptor protein
VAPLTQPKAATPRVAAVRLLDVDRELARRLGPDAAEARNTAVSGVVTLPRGRWDPSAAAPRLRGGFGLLVLSGLVTRDVAGGEAVGAELVCQGDLVLPDDGAEELAVGLRPVWDVIEPCRLAVLDRAFVERVAPWPQIGAALSERVHRRAKRLAIALALGRLPRVEDRVHRLLWHLADRRGRVTGDGVVVPLPVTQEQLGRLVGARRPTVSLALRGLRERGLVSRRSDDEWLLAHEPPAGIELPDSAP